MIAVELSARLASLAVKTETGRIESSPSYSIRYQRWRPAQPVGSLLLIQGRGGYLEKYQPTIIQLLQRNLEVVSFEWRGQGLSDRLIPGSEAGHINDFADYVEDLERIVSELFAPDRDDPVHDRRYLLAHSMGAHVLLRWLAADHPDGGGFRQAWLTATLIKPNTSPYPRWVARLLSQCFCLIGKDKDYVFGGGPFDAKSFEQVVFSDLNSNAEQVTYELQCLLDNPGLRLGSATFGWLNQLFRSMAWLQTPGCLERITLPITQFLAGDEQVVDNLAAQRLQGRLQQGRLIEVPHSKHDLLLERGAVNAPLWAEIDRALKADP